MDNPQAIINLNNISHNIKKIKTLAPNSQILAPIKADAYGHGAVNLAKHLDLDNNISAYGVSRFSEAIKLHQAGITKPILLMEGIINKSQLIESVKLGFWLVVQNFFQLDLLKDLINLNNADSRLIPNWDKKTKPITIWIKFDTGMHRLGFLDSELSLVLDYLKILKNNNLINNYINNNIVVVSHLACSDEPDNKLNAMQLESFINIKNLFNKFNLQNNNIFNIKYSLANSGAIFTNTKTHFDWIRPGISLYGSSPLLNKTSMDLNLKPSMSMISKIIAIKNINPGDTVGYGATWVSQSPACIAIINTGYADCYPRVISNNTAVWLKNKKCNIIGRVSMDMLAIDCSIFFNNQIAIGDQVELWGSNISIDEVAKSCNTISYELYTRITSRVEKVYV